MKKIFDLLKGQWTIYRTMTAVTGASLGKCKGIVSFVSDKEKRILYYKEKGELQTFNKKFRFFKNYIYKFNSNGTDLEVYFDETPLRFFHSIKWKKPQGGIILGQGSTHKCAQDIYQLSYQLLSEHLFFVNCKVSGPKKNYILHSQFFKL